MTEQLEYKEIPESQLNELKEFIRETAEYIFSTAGHELPIQLSEKSDCQDNILIHQDIEELVVSVRTLENLVEYIRGLFDEIKQYSDTLQINYNYDNTGEEIEVTSESFDDLERVKRSYSIYVHVLSIMNKIRIARVEEKYQDIEE